MCESFSKGALYVRIHDGKDTVFFYPDEEVPAGYSSFHCQTIARIHRNAGELIFGGKFDMAQNGDRSGSGMLIEFRKATDDDLQNLLDAWKCRVSVAEWVECVRDYNPDLSQAEKDRIARIAQPYMM